MDRCASAERIESCSESAGSTNGCIACSRVYANLRLAERHPVVHNLVISNVPGPRFPLYFAGAKLVAMYPLGPVMDGAGLNITVLSYMDQLYFGLIGCREVVGVWDLAAQIHESFAELRKAADAVQQHP